MEQFKRAQIIMLPTNKSNIVLITSKTEFIIGTETGKAFLQGSKTFLQGGKNWIYNSSVTDNSSAPQYLYIISDDEIKKDDWCYNEISKTIFKATKQLVDLINDTNVTLTTNKKIIATTDTSLIEERRLMRECYPSTIGQPSQQFVEKFIEKYNKDSIITEVMVEYEIDKYDVRNQYQDCPSGKYWEDKPNPQSPDKLYSNAKYYIPKINPKDNSITIKKIKDSWNRDEIIDIIHKYTIEMANEVKNYHRDKWISKNL